MEFQNSERAPKRRGRSERLVQPENRIGQFLYAAWERSGVTQRELALRMNKSRAEIHRLLTGEEKLTYDEVRPLAKLLGIESDTNTIFALAGMPPEVGPAPREASEQVALLRQIQNDLLHWQTTDSNELDQKLAENVFRRLLTESHDSPKRLLPSIDELLVLTRSRSSEAGVVLTALLLMLRMTVEIRQLWPDYDPGAENAEGKIGTYMFYGVDKREFEHTRRNAPAAIAIADRYLSEYQTLPAKSSSAQEIFGQCAGVLMMGYLTLHGVEHIDDVTTAVDGHLRRVGGKMGVAEDASDENIGIPHVIRQMRFIWE